jgi:hypothetical protein
MGGDACGIFVEIWAADFCLAFLVAVFGFLGLVEPVAGFMTANWGRILGAEEGSGVED